MHQIVENFERNARFKDDNEAEIIRQKLERLVSSIQVQVAKRDKRFQSTLIQIGSVYEGVKVQRPDEFDFKVRIDCLTNKSLLYPCENNPGYLRLAQDVEKWKEFQDEQGFFSPNKLCRHFKRLVNESWSTIGRPRRNDHTRSKTGLHQRTVGSCVHWFSWGRGPPVSGHGHRIARPSYDNKSYMERW